MAEYDLVVRAGTVVDGTGSPARTADVAVRDGVVVEVGRVAGSGSREIDADGALVAPGWVDIHTHYDGQATWDSRLSPSSWHGVTTAVMGNCGVGFAPVHDPDHQQLIEIMEGVEDIPGTALHEGLKWNWNTFGEFLDALDARPHDMDIAAYLPHNPLRLHVMGERGAHREPATDADIAEMGRLARLGISQGAIGFSTDRTVFHKTSRGEQVPAYGAAARECVGIAKALHGLDSGVLQLVSDFADIDGEFEMMRQMVQASGLPISFALTYGGQDEGRQRMRKMLGELERAEADGITMRGQVAARSVGMIYGLQCTLNPFSTNPVFAEIADLAPAEQAKIMRQDDFRARVLASVSDELDGRIGGSWLTSWQLMYELSDPPNYEPDAYDSLAARAARAGRTPQEIAYDILLADDGQGLIYLPAVGYREGNLDAVKELLEHPHTLPGLSDGGAHVGTICDASFPTYLLSHWGRDRARGTLDVEYLVKKQSADTARFVGLADRGVVAPGFRADLNVIDLDGLALHRPEIRPDLPAGGSRLVQRVDGYLHTIVKGLTAYENGVATDALPGRLVRGAQPGPKFGPETS